MRFHERRVTKSGPGSQTRAPQGLENPDARINLAFSVRLTKQAEAILLRAQAIHLKVAMIAFNLACYASVTGRMEDAKERLRNAIELDKDVRKLALDDEDLRPLWDWIAGLQ